MRKRIIISLILLFLLFLSGAYFTISYITNTTTDLGYLIKLHRIEVLTQDLVINVQAVQAQLYTVGTAFEKGRGVIMGNLNLLDNAIKRCGGCHHSTDTTSKRVSEVKNLTVLYKKTLSKLITTGTENEEFEKLQSEAVNIGNTILSQTREMAFVANKTLNEKTTKALEDIKGSRIILIAALVLFFLIAAVVAVSLTKSITRPISELLEGTRKIKAGELGYTISYAEKNEFGELSTAFNDMSTVLEENNERIISQMQELRDAQKQLIQAAKSELSALGELSSSIAHELNNPLTGILGYAGLIKEEKDMDSIMHHADVIMRESMRARDIVRQLFEFPRERLVDIKDVDINTILRNVVKFISVQLKNLNINAIEKYGEIPHISGDENQLEQVFFNIINNAIFTMPEGGNITISTGTRNEHVYIDISDTGRGIPEEIVQRIFKPSFITEKEKSLGVGLPISYRIIQSHGGKINIESEEGKGTRFIITFPSYNP
jgi:signal transduction histidine kinase